MSTPQVEQPELPEFMTWEELECLPEEIASRIELWDGRVVWVRRGPFEHQQYTGLFWAALRRSAQSDMSRQPERCWQVGMETHVFLRENDKSDFLTPDFLAFRRLGSDYADVRAKDVVLVGEVLLPANRQTDIEAKKARYADAGIPMYWEVTLARDPRGIAAVRAYALEVGHAQILPPGVYPLHRANYILVGEWMPSSTTGIEIDFPFPIRLSWSELDY